MVILFIEMKKMERGVGLGRGLEIRCFFWVMSCGVCVRFRLESRGRGFWVFGVKFCFFF